MAGGDPPGDSRTDGDPGGDSRTDGDPPADPRADGDPIAGLRADDPGRRRAAAREVVDPGRGGWDRLEEARETLAAALEDPDPVVRGHALVAFHYSVVVPVAPEEKPVEGVRRVVTALTDPDAAVRRTALGLLVTSEWRGGVDEGLQPSVSAGLFECLTGDSPALRERAARLLTAGDLLAHPDPGTPVSWLVDRLAEAGADGRATDHLPAVARRRPDLVAPHADRLSSLLVDEDGETRELAARTLAATAGEASFDHERVRSTLTGGRDPADYYEDPGIVTGIADLARADRSLAADHVERLLPGLFEGDRDRRRAGAAMALTLRPHPGLAEDLEPLVEHLREDGTTLDADPLSVLARASPDAVPGLLETAVEAGGIARFSPDALETLAEANPDVGPDLVPTVRRMLSRDRTERTVEGIRAVRGLSRTAPAALDGLREDLIDTLGDPERERAEWLLEALFRAVAAGETTDSLGSRNGVVERHLVAVGRRQRYFAAVTLAAVGDADAEPGLGARIREALTGANADGNLPLGAGLRRYLDRHYPGSLAEPERLCWRRSLPGPDHALFDRRFPLGVVAECRPDLAERAVTAAGEAIPDASRVALRRDVGTALSRVATADGRMVAEPVSALSGIATDGDADERRRTEATRALALVALGDSRVVARAVDPDDLPPLDGATGRLRAALDGRGSFRDLAVGMPG